MRVRLFNTQTVSWKERLAKNFTGIAIRALEDALMNTNTNLDSRAWRLIDTCQSGTYGGPTIGNDGAQGNQVNVAHMTRKFASAFFPEPGNSCLDCVPHLSEILCSPVEKTTAGRLGKVLPFGMLDVAGRARSIISLRDALYDRQKAFRTSNLHNSLAIRYAWHALATWYACHALR